MEDNTLVGRKRRPLLKVDPTRRSVLKTGAATLAASTVFAPAVLRADNLVIKVGHIAPKTGPMAGFAEAQDWTLAGIRQVLAPGLQIGGKTYKVEIIAKDGQTDESRTAEVASELILKDKVDIITASSGSNRLQSDRQHRRAQRGALHHCRRSLGVLLLRPQSAEGGLHLDLSFLLGPRPGSRLLYRTLEKQQTNKVVGTLFNTAQDDTSWHNAFIPAIKKAGFAVVDPGQFPAFGNDSPRRSGSSRGPASKS